MSAPYWKCPECELQWSAEDIAGHRALFLDRHDGGRFVLPGCLIVMNSEKVV